MSAQPGTVFGTSGREPAGRDPAGREPADCELADHGPAGRGPTVHEPADREPAGRESADHDPADREPAGLGYAGSDPADAGRPGVGPADVESADVESADVHRGGDRPVDTVPPVAADVLHMAARRLRAATGRPWDDVTVVRADGPHWRAAVNVCRAQPAVAVLTEPGAGPAELAAALHGWERTMVVVEEPGGPGERVTVVDAERAASVRWLEPALVLCLRNAEAAPTPGWYAGGEPIPPPGGWGLPDDRFSHRDGMLPAEARAVALARLAPRPGVLVWDIGAGPGAMSVECARMGAAVLAVEPNPGQCIRLIANVAAHGVEVCVVEDSAPGVFGMLPEPDAIFVGGGGPGVVAACADVGAERIVVALTSLDSFGGCSEALYGNGYAVDGCQVSVSRFAGPAGATRLAPASPVVLLCGTRERADQES